MPRVGSHFGSATDKCQVHAPAQLAVVGMGHHREEARALEGNHPALQIAAARRIFGGRDCRGRQTRQLFHIIGVIGPGIGGIQYIVGKLAG